MEAKLVSVIIPTYNVGRFLSAALDSVFAQDYRPIEVIVVDDGSTDDTAVVVRSFPGVRYIHQANQGPPAARNTGLANSTGELIAFLDADDRWTPNKLSAQARYLAEHPEVGCVIGRLQNYLDENAQQPSWIPASAMNEGEGTLGMQASLLQRWVFDRVGPFNAQFTWQDDLEWLIRVREAGIGIAFTPDIFVHRRIHASNISRDQQSFARARFRALKDHLDRVRGKASKSATGAPA